VTLRTCVNLIALFARLVAPVMPFTAERVLEHSPSAPPIAAGLRRSTRSCCRPVARSTVRGSCSQS